MKNYSSKPAKRGRTAYRTPSVKRYQLALKSMRLEIRPKKMSKILSNSWKVFGFEAGLFALAMALGLLAGWRLNYLLKLNIIAMTPVSIWQVFLSFILATLAFLAVIYFFRLKKARRGFFKLILWGTLVLGNLFFASLWLNNWLVLVWLVVLIYLLVKKPLVGVYNIALVLAMAGVSAGLGAMIDSWIACLMMLVFSVYDFVAVYITKHMVTMAKEMVEQQAVVGLVIPRRKEDFTAPISEVRPDSRFLILGGGDVVFPALLAISCLQKGWLGAVIVAIASLLGLLFVFLIFINRKERRPLPALPPIALLAVLGYFLTTLL